MKGENAPSGAPIGLPNDQTYEAQERTGLAEERTFAAWLRTGLAMIGVGIGAAKLLPETAVPGLARLLGVVLVAGGAATFLLGYHTYHRSLDNLIKAGYRLAPGWLINTIIGALLVAVLLALLLVLF